MTPNSIKDKLALVEHTQKTAAAYLRFGYYEAAGQKLQTLAIALQSLTSSK